MLSTLKTLAYAGLGIQDKLNEVLEDLAKRGQQSKGEMAKTVAKAFSNLERRGKELRGKENHILNRVAEGLGLPSKNDIDRLEKKIQELSKRKTKES
ncbi:MAG TPA: hypothetical protein VGB26_04430 [Nitrospiria bacterium]